MEANRQWVADWEGLQVQVQRTATLTKPTIQPSHLLPTATKTENPLLTGLRAFTETAEQATSPVGIATLIGNVVIQRGANVIQGQRGVMDLNSNVARMMPGGDPGEGGTRVQGLFVRDQAKPGAAGTDAKTGGERKHP